MKLNVGKYAIHRWYGHWDGQEWDDFPFFHRDFQLPTPPNLPPIKLSNYSVRTQKVLCFMGNLGWGEKAIKLAGKWTQFEDVFPTQNGYLPLLC